MAEANGETPLESPPGGELVALLIEEHRKEVEALNALIAKLCERIFRQGELIASYARKGR